MTSAVEVPAGFDVKKVLVSVSITHTWRGDLEISVVAPNGQTAMLSNREGAQSDHFIVVNRDITGSFAIGNWGPGAWRLVVRDLGAGDIGTINSFSLQITPLTDTITTVTTGPGQRRPSLGAPSSGSSSRDVVSPPTCLTYDDLPVTSPAEIQEKFDRLWSSYEGPVPTTVPAPTFKQAIVNRLKLMYELWGEQLRNEHDAADQAHRAAALYTTHPDDNPSCVSDIDAPTPEAACTSPAVTTKRGELIRCQRLLGQHASEGVASLAINDCATLLSGYLDLAEQPAADHACGGEHLRDIGSKALFQLEDKQLGMISKMPTTLGNLSRQLWLLDRWYAISKRADEVGVFAAPDQQRRDTSYLLGRFWRSVRANSGADEALADVTRATRPDQAEAALGVSMGRSRSADQAVVSALFTVPSSRIQPENVELTRPPLRGLPLLAMLGDALKPLVDDLDGIAIFHDIACQFRDGDQDCRAPVTSTPSRHAWDILANLETSGAGGLGRAVTATQFALAGWKPVFESMVGQQAALSQAVSLAVAEPGGLAAATAEADVHPLARPLWVLYQHARAFHGHYEATGQFESTAPNQLQGSLLEQDQQEVVDGLRRRAGTLGGEVARYQSGLVAALQAQIAAMDAGARIADLTSQRLRKAVIMEQKSTNLEGLRASGEDEDDAFASLAASFADIQGALDNGAYVRVGDTETFSLNGRSGLFTTSRDPVNLAVHTIPNLAKGQMLLVQTSGAWTPTCSLDAGTYLRDDGGDPIHADLSDAEIGPEGYTLSISGSSVAAHSAGHAWGLEERVGTSIEYCHDTGIFGTIYGVKPKACVFASATASRSDTWSGSSGSESRTTAAFATGFRLSTTPFPEAPVGSLLVVLVNPATRAVRNIQVVHSGGTSVLIEDPSIAYFVVNDKQCTTAAIVRHLDVSVRPVRRATDVAEQALAAMIDVIQYMRGQQQELAKQGTLLPNQATVLRQQASSLLQANLEIDVTELPGPLANLFEAFVSHQIVATERRIEIAALHRSLDLDLIEMRAIDDELLAGDRHARLQRLVPQWLLRDLDHDTLRNSLVDLLSVSRDHLKPILELWYPHALDGVSLEQDLSVLLDADIDTSLITLAAAGQRFVEVLVNQYEEATFGAKPNAPQLPLVVLSFPRPGAEPTNVFWREADPARARRVWDAIDHHTSAHFEITPDDFYSRNGGDGVLPCTEVVPLIKTMAIHVVRPGGDSSNLAFNNLGRRFQGHGGVTQSFVTLEGPRVYELADSLWQSFQLPIRYGETENTLSTFLAAPRQTRPVGLSATGSFEVDFSVLNSLPAAGGLDHGDPFEATEVQLVMEVDSRAVGTRPTWVPRCH